MATLKLSTLIARLGITMVCEPTNSNPNFIGSDDMDHWCCELRKDKRRMTVPFSCGVGHNGKAPKVEDVLDCLASDSASIENAQSFEEWCAEYGYDTNSRKAEKTFKICQRQAAKLKQFMDSSAGYNQLLFNTERL